MTESVYEQQLRRQLYEAQQEVVRLRGDRDSLEREVGPLRQRLDEALRRAERAEAALAAPCLEPVQVGAFGKPFGPCVVQGPHVEHRASDGCRWVRLDAASPEAAHECVVSESDGEWNVSCTACPAYIDNVGSEGDAEQWATVHFAAVDRSGVRS